ncbi:alpha-1,3-mannosyl-glycoprotein 4-beta-N-acetylglucosaminyltransferase C-like [Xenia sp. Carnegie-2017]|uniref:alpha-1,3-mannosyl-glycoprotein 4-beta-N-acetylglucosaminyltransferase C-like n=1 Tax=Xenia sp. Carnegie-2017 TaxID=2897299 RepID=UPI001F041744|nr:alpha-1,3-mannosyl-glycoprotein 4-beta-N-acetylglucosaminyltransferase C-like [Xenia sp. Carnegie-2017]
MRILGGRKLLTLLKIIFIFSCIVIAISFISSQKPKKLGDIMQYLDETVSTEISNPTQVHSFNLASACLSRSILDSNEVKLHSNRSSDKEYTLTIGISTITRDNGNVYLMDTLSSLTVDQTVGTITPNFLIVLQLGDSSKQKRIPLANKIQQKYMSLVNEGTLDIIQVFPPYYPSFEKLKRRFNDNEKRVKWRSKQVIDFSFLFCYCYGLSKYHLQLEDDIKASPYYYPKLMDFIDSYENKETWFTLDASMLGYIGKVYHNYDLNEIATFYYIFYDEMPVDWMEYNWRNIKGQAGRWRFRVASLFEHYGDISSLRSKPQKTNEAYFDKYSQKYLGHNPPAVTKTNLIPKMRTNIDFAYNQGARYFWGTCNHQVSCHIVIIFQKAMSLRSVIVETGGNIAINDRIKSGWLKLGTTPDKNNCLHYHTPLGSFVRGTLAIEFKTFKKVRCIQIEVQSQQEWVLIREINVWPGQQQP